MGSTAHKATHREKMPTLPALAPGCREPGCQASTVGGQEEMLSPPSGALGARLREEDALSRIAAAP